MSKKDTQYAERLLPEIAKRLNEVGFDMSAATVILRLEDSAYAVGCGKKLCSGMEGGAVSVITQGELKHAYPLFYDLFISLPKTGIAMQAAPRFCRLAARTGQSLPPVLDDMAQIIGPYARVCNDKDNSRRASILKRQPACLTRGADGEGGMITAARTQEELFTAALVLEKAAQVFFLGKLLGGTKAIKLPEAYVMHLGYKLMYSRKAGSAEHYTAASFPYAIPPAEMKLRGELVELGRRLRQRNLVQGTWGNISARLDGRYMLCTPSGLDYESLTPYDMVRVDIKTLEYEGAIKPTSEKNIHAAILKAHSAVKCVIHAHPPWSSVFAAAHKEIPIQDSDTRELLCGNAKLAAYGFPGSKALSRNVAAAIGDNRACVMENHGMLVCGASLEDAFEKCMAVENTARAVLEALSADCG